MPPPASSKLRQRKPKPTPMVVPDLQYSHHTSDDRPQRRERRGILLLGLLLLAVLAAGLTVGLVVSRPSSSSGSNGSSSTSINKDNEPAPDSHADAAQPTTQTGRFDWLETVPHDATAFTQGLHIILIERGDNENASIVVYEGTGLYGQSELRQVDLLTGTVLQSHALAATYFGEGIVHYYSDDVDNESPSRRRILQLTWKEQTAFVFDAATLQPIANLTYTTTTTEGWGITERRRQREGDSVFYVSDGSSFLHVWNKTTLAEIKRIPVTYQNADMPQPVAISMINELEWDPATDTILANVWYQDVILRIDPETGFCKTIYDLQALFPDRPSGADVLNGIALAGSYSSASDDNQEVWVTGKLWPHMFRIRLVD